MIYMIRYLRNLHTFQLIFIIGLSEMDLNFDVDEKSHNDKT